MKHMGTYRVGCQCCNCIGKPGTVTKKKIRKSQKSRARQEANKALKEAIKEAPKSSLIVPMDRYAEIVKKTRNED